MLFRRYDYCDTQVLRGLTQCRKLQRASGLSGVSIPIASHARWYVAFPTDAIFRVRGPYLTVSRALSPSTRSTQSSKTRTGGGDEEHQFSCYTSVDDYTVHSDNVSGFSP